MLKTKVAFIKFGGLAAGGTEKALQTIAANLPKDEFEVDYFYCDAAPYIGSDYMHSDTDPYRKKYVEESGVQLIRFDVAYKDITKPTHPWLDTDFWELFDEAKYDIIQTGRSGHPEYPFIHINKTPQIDLITLPGMAERKSNVFRTIHISQYQANSWIQAGGDASNYDIIPLFDELPELSNENLRDELNLEGKFVFGFHQRDNDGIYSPVPLSAYKAIETDETAFVLLGGSNKYEEQAWDLELKNFIRLDHTGDKEKIHKFLGTVDVYTHGRADGETYSLAIAEAMYHGKPIVSHVAPATGHIETIGEGGVVVETVDAYTQEMQNLLQNVEYRAMRSKNSKQRFDSDLSLEVNMKRWVELYHECINQKSKDDMPDDEFWESMW